MGEKESNWLEHLKAAESSGLKLSAYAANHQIDVRRLRSGAQGKGVVHGSLTLQQAFCSNSVWKTSKLIQLN